MEKEGLAVDAFDTDLVTAASAGCLWQRGSCSMQMPPSWCSLMLACSWSCFFFFGPRAAKGAFQPGLVHEANMLW